MSEVLGDEEVRALKAKVADLAEQAIVFNGKPLELERPWQYNMVASTYSREAYNTSRQIGKSFGISVRSVIRAHWFPDNSYNAVLVSINREEAREKIRYAEQLLSGMACKKKVLTDNKMEIEFDNGNTIRSFPSRPVRGIPNVDLLLDEFAHIPDAREIYAGSTASTVRQAYGVTITSTPYGSGCFSDILSGAGHQGEYRSFHRVDVPWWLSTALCRDVFNSSIFAEGMTTEERVTLFGKPNLILEYENLPLEVFQQEFEASVKSYGNTALTEQQILDCSNGAMFCETLDLDYDNKAQQHEILLDTAIKNVESYARDKHLKMCFVGVDVGATINATEVTLFEWTEGKLQARLYLTIRRAKFTPQKDALHKIMLTLPVKMCVIDMTGIGRNLAEDMKETYGSRVTEMNFHETTKAVMVGNMQKAFQDGLISVYPTRRMLTQLLAVRTIVSANDNVLFRSSSAKDTDSTGTAHKSHADLFWSVAMAVTGAFDYLKMNTYRSTLRSPRLRLTTSGWSGRIIPVGRMPSNLSMRMISGRGR